ncbi:MAG TPA: hypothetical protein VIT00_11145 [Terrimicrobiaceae bacterium]
MSTLAEIEAAIPELTAEEMDALARKLDEIRAVRRGRKQVFTGNDAVRWWREMKHLLADEAEAFARAVDAARAEMNRPPTAPRWE